MPYSGEPWMSAVLKERLNQAFFLAAELLEARW